MNSKTKYNELSPRKTSQEANALQNHPQVWDRSRMNIVVLLYMVCGCVGGWGAVCAAVRDGCSKY